MIANQIQFPAYALKSDDGKNQNQYPAYAVKSDDSKKDQKKPISSLCFKKR